MTITDTEGSSHNLSGSLCGGVIVGNIDLTQFLRVQLPIEGLLVFDALNEYEEE